MQRKLTLFALAFGLVAAACGASAAGGASTTGPGTSVTGAAPPTTGTEATQDTTTTVAATGGTDGVSPQFELASCSEDGDLDLVCEAYSILTREYVDPVDDAALAEGAARGIEEFIEEDVAPPEDAPDRFVCQIPSDPFTVTCEAAAAVLVDADLETVEQAAVQGMLEFGLNDPNTVYLSPEVLERIREDSSGEISGIGALVDTRETLEDGTTRQCFVLSETCRMTIVGLIEGGPAEAAGLQVGDVTVSVDGEPVIGLTADEVVARVRGPEGTQVVLGIERDGRTLEVTITRAKIVIPVVQSAVPASGVGYIALSQFTANSDELFHDELAKLLDGGVTKLIFDLRNNPGGALTAAIGIASEFLPEGTILQTISPGETRAYEVEGGGLATSDGIEVLILVNGASASASEVVAAALQEAGRATIMGEPTFGKNTVQQQFSLSNGGAIKVTIARWVTPSGTSFGGDGVQPDILLEVPPDADTDVVLERALEFYGVEAEAA